MTQSSSPKGCAAVQLWISNSNLTKAATGSSVTIEGVHTSGILPEKGASSLRKKARRASRCTLCCTLHLQAASRVSRVMGHPHVSSRSHSYASASKYLVQIVIRDFCNRRMIPGTDVQTYLCTRYRVHAYNKHFIEIIILLSYFQLWDYA